MPKKKEWPKTVSVGPAAVKVYRTKHPRTTTGWLFILTWKTASGRKRETFAEETLALTEAKAKASQIAAGRIEGASMTTGDRDELLAARKIAGDVPVLAALEEWAKARELTIGNIIPAAEAWAARNGKVQKRITVAEVVKEFTAAKTAAQKNVSRDHRYSFKRITEDLGAHFIDTVSSKQLDAWLAKWAHPVTRNTRRKRIVSIWRWARKKGYLPRDAQTEAEMTDSAHEPAPVIGIIDGPRYEAALRHFDAHHKELLAALTLAGMCGLRRTEIHAQLWEDINFERKHLFVTSAKRGTPARRLVPLCDAAIAWLKRIPSRKGHVCPLVEGERGPQPSLAVDGIRRIIKDAALFPGWELPKNCFRHSYISHRVAATGDIPRTSMDAGNSVEEINRHYRELVTPRDGKRFFEIFPHREPNPSGSPDSTANVSQTALQDDTVRT